MKSRYLGGLVNTLDDAAMLRESAAALDAARDPLPLARPQPIESLSGGQRQAVAIARAVYWDARLMIMDEPTNNLGVPEQHKVLELIRRLRDQGVPVILITHTLPDVFAVTDRVVVMHRGRKVDREADRRHRAPRSWCSTWSARATTSGQPDRKRQERRRGATMPHARRGFVRRQIRARRTHRGRRVFDAPARAAARGLQGAGDGRLPTIPRSPAPADGPARRNATLSAGWERRAAPR